MNYKYYKKIIYIILCIVFCISLVSCAPSIDYYVENIEGISETLNNDNINNYASNNNELNTSSTNDLNNDLSDDYKIVLTNYLNGEEVWVLKSQTIAQNLSVIVKTAYGELIIFDGGRKEDAKYLHDFIMKNGGTVHGWFLTHIHDDHVGAIYEIMDKYDDIKIENLCYNFADFDFYYKSEGENAGIVVLLEEKFKEYFDNIYKNAESEGLDPTHFEKFDKVKKDDWFAYSEVIVRVMNDIYKVDHDSVNNSSIVYKVFLENTKTMIVLGDLAYLGGEELIKDYKDDMDKLKSDIVVMAHHGQGGVGEEVYKAINPEVAIWPTTEKIYMNTDKNYHTDDTKKWLSDIGVKYNVLSYEGTQVIK